MHPRSYLGVFALAVNVVAFPSPQAEVTYDENPPRGSHVGAREHPHLVAHVPRHIDTSNTHHLTPRSWHQLHYAHKDRKRHMDQSQFHARVSTEWKYPTVVLDHSEHVAVACSGASISITFEEEHAFQHAQDVWDRPGSMVFVTSESSCADSAEGVHTYFRTNGLRFDAERLLVAARGSHETYEHVHADTHIEFGEYTAIPKRRQVATRTVTSSTASSVPTSTTGGSSSAAGTPSVAASATAGSASAVATCATPTSTAINGLPAAACGPSFDAALDKARGYYPVDTDSFASSWAQIAPGISDVNWQDYELDGDYDSLAARALVERKISFHFTLPKVLQKMKETIVQKASAVVSAVKSIGPAIKAAAAAAVKTVVAFVKAILDGDFEVPLLYVPVVVGLPRFAKSSFGQAALLYNYIPKKSDRNYYSSKKQLDANIKSGEIKGVGDVPHLAIYCVECGVLGHFSATGFLKFNKDGIYSGGFSVHGALDANITVGIEALAIARAESKKKNFINVGAPGFSIPGIVVIGPQFRADIGLFAEAKVEGLFLAGAGARIKDAQATMDYVARKASSKNWKPQTEKYLQYSAKIGAGVGVELPLTVAFGIDVLKGKFRRSVSLTDSTALILEAAVEFAKQTRYIQYPNGTEAEVPMSDDPLNDGECDGVKYNLKLEKNGDVNIIGLLDIPVYKFELPIFGGCIGHDKTGETSTDSPAGTSTARSTALATAPTAAGPVTSRTTSPTNQALATTTPNPTQFTAPTATAACNQAINNNIGNPLFGNVDSSGNAAGWYLAAQSPGSSYVIQAGNQTYPFGNTFQMSISSGSVVPSTNITVCTGTTYNLYFNLRQTFGSACSAQVGTPGSRFMSPITLPVTGPNGLFTPYGPYQVIFSPADAVSTNSDGTINTAVSFNVQCPSQGSAVSQIQLGDVSLGTPFSPSIVSCFGEGQTYTNAAGQRFQVHCNLDLWGGGFPPQHATSMQNCMDLCSGVAGCLGITWVPSRFANCYFKDGWTNPAIQGFECDSALVVNGVVGGSGARLAVKRQSSTTDNTGSFFTDDDMTITEIDLDNPSLTLDGTVNNQLSALDAYLADSAQKATFDYDTMIAYNTNGTPAVTVPTNDPTIPTSAPPTAYIQLADSTNSFHLAAGADGGFYLAPPSLQDTSGLFAYSTDPSTGSAAQVIAADLRDRLFIYYPAEITAYGVSRFRLAAFDAIPVGAQLVSLSPVTIGSDAMYVAVDTLGKTMYLAAVNYAANGPSDSTKLFLVKDTARGLAALRGATTRNTVTGGVVSAAFWVALTTTPSAALG